MISDPKLPFPGDPTGVRTAAGIAPEAPSESPAGISPESAVAETSNRPVSRQRPSTSHLWLRRVTVLLFVFLCATIGVMLMIVPWRPEWSENPLLIPYPSLRDFVSSGFVRGLVTGLGLLNVWIGFWEAMQYREDE